MPTDFQVLWSSEANSSIEHFNLRNRDGSWLLGGVVALEIDGLPGHIVYEVEVDGAWSTKKAVADVTSADNTRRIDIRVESGRWVVDGLERADLAGCVDVDLGWTPATNILPMRRCEPPVGETIEIEAAWVQLPDMTVSRALQTYQRLSEAEWAYRSARYEARIVTTREGLVIDYDNGLWIAQRPPSGLASDGLIGQPDG